MYSRLVRDYESFRTLKTSDLLFEYPYLIPDEIPEYLRALHERLQDSHREGELL